jgi:hypothetical protein
MTGSVIARSDSALLDLAEGAWQVLAFLGLLLVAKISGVRYHCIARQGRNGDHSRNEKLCHIWSPGVRSPRVPQSSPVPIRGLRELGVVLD